MIDVTVNGETIPDAAILAEAQLHPAASGNGALAAAAEALVVRQLLLQEARRRGLSAAPHVGRSGRRQADDDALIERLLETEIRVPEADRASCRRYYDNNRARFRSPERYEAAHILLPAAPDDPAKAELARAKAVGLIAAITADRASFGDLARAHSACPSAADGGRLGTIARGQTVPELDSYLAAIDEGPVCPVPVRTRYGVHVLRLDRRIPGKDLAFTAVADVIAGYLREASWRQAVAQYISMLAENADIKGLELEASGSRLVQ